MTEWAVNLAERAVVVSAAVVTLAFCGTFLILLAAAVLHR